MLHTDFHELNAMCKPDRNNFLNLNKFFVTALSPHRFGWAFSRCSEWGCSLLVVPGHLLLRSVDSRAQAQWLWHTGLVALCHVASSWTRDQTHVPCVGRWILNQWTTREVQVEIILK